MIHLQNTQPNPVPAVPPLGKHTVDNPNLIPALDILDPYLRDAHDRGDQAGGAGRPATDGDGQPHVICAAWNLGFYGYPYSLQAAIAATGYARHSATAQQPPARAAS